MNETPRDIARLLAQDVERVCLELLPQGKKVGHEWCVGSLEGEAGNSLKVRLTGPKAGLWADFAGTERGDLLNLWVDVRKEGIGRAMREAKEFLGIVDSEPYRYSDKEYQRPKRLKAWKPAKPDSPVMAYLKSRGLTEETIKAFKISEMDGNLPPFDKLPNNPGTIIFPSLRPDENGDMELVSVKYLALYREPAKDGSNNHKKFTQLSGANFEPVLFGWQALDKDTRKVALSEGECFRGDTEILTVNGWVRFDEYTSGTIAQWDNGEISFVNPLSRIEKQFNGELIEYSSGQFYSLTTPGHNLVSLDHKGRVYKHTASDGPRGKMNLIPRCGVANGTGIPLTNEQIALCIAVSADAGIDYRKNGGRYAKFGLKKQRKITRLENLTDNLGIKISNRNIANGYRSMCFSLPEWVPGRILPWEWVSQASTNQREFILSELIEWDGNSVPNRTMTEYSSKYLENAEWVQAMAHLSGRCSTIVYRENEFGSWLKVTILNNKSTSSWQSVKYDRIPYVGKVYCVQVPSGAILVRHNNIISVSGNCDAATLHQWGIPALSLPMGGGGGNKQQWVEREYPLLERFDEIFLCLDMDKAGQEATNELIERLGRHRCRVVKLPYKDANECLMKGVTKDEIMECFRKSAFVAPAELKTAKEFRDKVHQFLHPPTAAAIGQSLPWSYTFAQGRFAFRPKQVSIWSGYNGHGKTTMLSYCMMHAINCGQVCCMASLEMPGEITVLKAVRQTSCKEIPDDDELDASLNWLGDRLWIYDHIGDQKLKEVLDVLLYARRRYGATQLIIDSLMMLSVDGDDYNEQARITKKLKEFARDHNCHIHMVVHPKKAKERGQTPDSSDVKGTGTQTDAVDNVLLVWQNKKKLMAKRDQQLRGIPMPYDLSQEPDATLTIDKNRMTGWTAVIPLWFNDASCQYLSDPNDLPILYAPCSRVKP